MNDPARAFGYPDLAPLYQRFRDVSPVVSISDSQRRAFAGGLKLAKDGLSWTPSLGSLKFQASGRKISSISGPIFSRKGRENTGDRDLRGEAGIELKIAAKVDRVDQRLLRRRHQAFVEVRESSFWRRSSHSEKSEFLGGALALLTPVQWPEPFGLVMIEAMACGTP